jgi:predicted Zn-dependent protease
MRSLLATARVLSLPALLLCSSSCLAQLPAAGVKTAAVYPDAEVSAVWHALGAAYVRKALDDRTLDRDPALNVRIDAVTAKVAAAVAAIEPRFPVSYWRTILVDGFGHGATAFPGGTLIVDATFVRRHELTDEELALVIAHEMAHVVAGHASEKLSFMAGLMRDKAQAPSAHAALIAFFTSDGHADAFRPIALQQEREADRIGARFLAKSGYDPQRALLLFDKLTASEARGEARGEDTHDGAAQRKQAVLRAIEEIR